MMQDAFTLVVEDIADGPFGNEASTIDLRYPDARSRQSWPPVLG
jgi:hypothetical protein